MLGDYTGYYLKEILKENSHIYKLKVEHNMI